MRNNSAKLNEDQKEQLIADLKAGMLIQDVMAKYDLARSSVSYYRKTYAPGTGTFHANRIRLWKYDWPLIQCWYDEGHSIRDCQRKFGFTSGTAVKASRRGDIVFRPPSVLEIPNDVMFSRNAGVTRNMVKRRIIRDGLLPYECSIECCPIIDEWNGEKLVLHLDHINGDKHDHRLENLRFLCPNCHSQTDTYTGRNKLSARSRAV